MRSITNFRKIWLVAISFLLPVFIAMPNVYAATGYTWNQTLSEASLTENFVNIASSASGENLTAVGEGGNIFTSSNYGSTWTDETEGTAASGQYWVDVSMSASGQYQTALANNADVWHSSNYGSTWTDVTAGTSLSGNNWQDSTTSSSGQYVVAVNYNDIFVSSDYGLHFTNETAGTALTSDYWNNTTMSASGQYIYVVSDSNAIYGSSNYGSSWSELVDNSSLTADGWSFVNSSASGQNLVASDYGGDLYTSNNYGDTWKDATSGTSASGLPWATLSSSATGQYIVAIANDNSGTDPTPVYISRDYGSTWTDVTAGTPLQDTYWKSAAMSASGERIAVAAGTQGIYGADDPSLRPAAPVISKSVITTTLSVNGSATVNVFGDASGYDPDTLSIISGPSHGTVVDPPGDLIYTPNKGFIGTDSLTYQLCAPLDDTVCSQATLSFDVAATAPDTGFGTPKSSNPLESYSIYTTTLSIVTIALGIRKYSNNKTK
jgi:hypothetical protein